MNETGSNPVMNRHCRDVLIAMRKIMRAIDIHSRALARDYGITMPQLILLQEVASCNGISVTELGKSISLSQATVTDIVARLEKKGLVVKRKSGVDKRCVELFETDACNELLRKAPPPLQEKFIRRFSRLEEWEQLMILSSLRRVVDIMAAGDDGSISPVLAAGPIAQDGEEIGKIFP